MERLVIAVALALVAVAAAAVLRRRRPDPPTQDKVAVPRQLDRREFARPDAPWLVAVFTSTTCDSCQRATEKARALESADVAYDDIPWQTRRDLHDRYRVTDVPMVLVADADGVVQKSWVGTPPSDELSEAMAQLGAPVGDDG
jgi:hypothetical protein